MARVDQPISQLADPRVRNDEICAAQIGGFQSASVGRPLNSSSHGHNNISFFGDQKEEKYKGDKTPNLPFILVRDCQTDDQMDEWVVRKAGGQTDAWPIERPYR